VNSEVDHAFLAACRGRLPELAMLVPEGEVRAVVGTAIEVVGIPAQVGALCRLHPRGAPILDAEVVGFRGGASILMPLGESAGVGPGTRACLATSDASAPPASGCLGRVLDGLGRPLDGGPPPPRTGGGPILRKPESSLQRARITRPLDLGVRSINALLTVGRGSRVGLFAGSGVGKSTLMGQIARFTEADAVVVALIGERGREVREFVERDLGDALYKSVVVVATSDQAPLLRRRAALLATALAEDLRAEGKQVLLLMDSLTRFCTAQREIGLAAGEPPATRGFPPSVWAALPRLLERAGTAVGRGSITGIYTVLVEGDDMQEPVADAARALLDGHFVLSRAMAEKGLFPALDPLASVSRVMPDVVATEAVALAAQARRILATYRDAEDLISIGAYVEGSDPDIDEARRLITPLRHFLSQGREEAADLSASEASLEAALEGSTA